MVSTAKAFEMTLTTSVKASVCFLMYFLSFICHSKEKIQSSNVCRRIKQMYSETQCAGEIPCYHGNVMLAIMANIHRGGDKEDSYCDKLYPRVAQGAYAALWVMNKLNEENYIPGNNVGTLQSTV